MQRLFSLAAVAGVMAGMLWAVAPASASTPSPTSAPSIVWGPCSDPNLQAFNAQCGLLSVPLDYGNPSGTRIQLAVSRIPHTSSNYQGVILTNPGGPGGSGLGLNPFLIAQFQADGYGDAAGDYDWIGFDPRGVGSSIPAISCDPNYLGPDRPIYIPFTHQLLTTWLSRSQGYARDCASQGPAQTALLKHMTTADSARDMDSIRQALGQPQINYYGYSYGTYLGQVYGTLFPSHVRRMILDSNVDPRGVWYQDNLDQDVAFNRNINIWFGWLAQYNSIYHLGATEQAVARTLLYDRGQARLPSGGWGGRRRRVGRRLRAQAGLLRADLSTRMGPGVLRLGQQPRRRGGQGVDQRCTRPSDRPGRRQWVRGVSRRSSAPTCSGRRTGTSGAATTGGSSASRHS